MGSSPTLVQSPELSAVPRSGQQASVFGGTYSTDPDHYRYSIFRDGALVGSAVVQTTPEYHFTLSDSDVYHAVTATAEASFDGGVTYPISTAAIVNWTYQTDVIQPATLADGTMTRTSASGVLPMTFDINMLVSTSNLLQLRVEPSTLDSITYFGTMSVPEAAINSPFTIDISGASDPAPSPTITDFLPTGLGATDVLSVRQVTPDFEDTLGFGFPTTGIASNWMAVSPTDRAGHRFWRFKNTGTGNAFLKEIRMMLSAGGANVALGRTIKTDQAPPYGSFDPANFFDTVDSTDNTGELGPGKSVWLDFGVNAAIYQMTLASISGFGPPTDYTIDHSDDGTTWVNHVTRTGQTWSANEIKTELM